MALKADVQHLLN